nr:hypothetical protein [Tanacetum cinerariifolium]
MTEAQQLKLVTKRSRQQTHISQASGSGTDERTGSIPGVSDVPTYESEEELSWNSTDDEGDDDEGKDGDGDETNESEEDISWKSIDDEGDDDEGNDGDDDDGDDNEEGDGDDNEDDDGEEGNDDDQEDEGDDDEDDEEKGDDDEQASDEKEFIHPSLSTHTKEEPRDEESFDPILKTPEDTDDEGNGEENLCLNVGREEGHDKEEEEDELYKDININQRRGMELIFETTSQIDVQTPTSVAPLPMSAPTITPSTIATITTTQQAPTPPTIALSNLLQDLPNFGSLFGFNNRLRTLEANLSKFMKSNQFAGADSAIPGIVQRYMDQRMNEAVKVVVQIQSDHLRDKAQKENDDFLKTIDGNMQKIIKEQVKEQVKVQVSKILPKIKQTVNEQLKAEVLTRSSNSSKTSYAVADDLSEMELKKILIEKMEGNKSIHRSNEQRNLYKALVEAYESDKIILDTYGDTVTLKRRHDNDADKDEEPSAGSYRGPRDAKKERSLTSESATAEEPMQTTFQMEEPSHPEFQTGADDQPIVESSPHSEWFSQQKKPPTPNRDWNKTLPATHGSIQPWISELAKESDSRSSFNELMDTPMDFSNFLINRLKVDTLTSKLLAGPTYELMKGSCKSLLYGFSVNRESARDVYSKRRIIAVTKLKIVEWHNYKHLDWITVRRDDDKLYKFKEGDFKRLRIKDIEDMLLLLIQGKLTNLTVEERIAFNVSLRIDGTLTDVRNTLNDRLKGIRMKYLPQSIWRKSDKDRALAMIQAIDKRLKPRRIMRRLERFVGGRLYEGDFRMLQRTI